MDNYLTYETASKSAILGCAVSHCGTYCAFNSDVHILRIVSLRNIRYLDISNVNESLSDTLNTVYEVQMISPIRCIDFGKGSISKSRLPHRISKRRATYGYIQNVCLLAVGLQSGQVKIYSLVPKDIISVSEDTMCAVKNGGKAVLVLKDGIEELTTVSFSLDDSLRLVTASIDGKIRLWDMWDDGNMYKMINMSNVFRPNAVAWGNKCKHLCIVGSKGKGYIYQSEKPCHKITELAHNHYNDITTCKYSSDESLLGTCSYDTSVLIWCAGSYKPLLQIWPDCTKPSKIIVGGPNPQFMRCFDFSPGCVDLISVSDDQYIRLWNIEESRQPTHKILIHSNARKLKLTHVKFVPNSSYFFVSTSDGRLLLFEIPQRTQSLANLCRRTVRERLVNVINEMTPLNFTKDNLLIKQNQLHMISLSELQAQKEQRAIDSDCQSVDSGDGDLHIKSKTVKRICSTDDILSSSHEDLLVKNVVNELPLPGMLKSFLQFGLLGDLKLDNYEPRSNFSSGCKRAHSLK